ncbi:alpha/beta fold hydrolase [Ruegeria halocynthiae]|uniref:alpha/beta fold hydrolase n=1 Tax=Ruegeria halocynthiae TaxID=985054 RepID=UPI000569C46B|nr:alpha/beta hydrolase [Ruegeria halocynthiae]
MKFLKIAAFVLIGLVVVAGIGISMMMNKTLSYDELSKYAHETLTLSDGFQVNYADEGNADGPVVLMVHGGGATLADWTPWVPALAEKYRVVRVDMPGHGLTDPLADRTEYGPIKWAEVLKEFVDELGLGKFAIIGHSFGGDTVVRYTVSNPDDVTALVLVAAGGYIPTEEQITDQDRTFVALYDNPLGRYLLPRMLNRKETGKSLEIFFNDPADLTQEMIDESYDIYRYEKNLGAPIELLVNLYSDRYVEVSGLDTINVPTLIMWGDKDAIAPLDYGHRFNAAIKGSELTIYPDVGHMPMYEAVDQSTADLLRFLNSAETQQ